MTKYTPRGYPVPDDYLAASDVPAATDALATAVDADVGLVEDQVEAEKTRNDQQDTRANGQDQAILNNTTEINEIEARSITAGGGLTGGGTLGASRTVSVGQGSGILVYPDTITFDWAAGDARYSKLAHGHAAQANVGIGGPYTFQPGQQGGNLVFPHNLGRTPSLCIASVIDDDGDHSMVTSVTGWDSVNVTCTARNLGSSAETFRVGVIAI